MTLYKQIPAHAERGQTVTYEEATPAEISAAHPKCCHPDGTQWCKHYRRCDGAVYAETGDADDGGNPIVSILALDYCSRHTELKGETP